MQLEDAEARAMHAEYVALLILDFLSWVSEAKVVPVKARFEHEARGDPAECRRVLGRPPPRIRGEVVFTTRRVNALTSENPVR